MKRLVFLVFAALLIAFPSPAQAEEDKEQTCPRNDGQSTAQYSQYQAPGCGETSIQSIKEGLEDAVENSGEEGAAVEGTKSYIGELSPEEAKAEGAQESRDAGSVSASEMYDSLPDTGGSPLLLPAGGAVLLAGGSLLRLRYARGK